jgi:hypothetical protein
MVYSLLTSFVLYVSRDSRIFEQDRLFRTYLFRTSPTDTERNFFFNPKCDVPRPGINASHKSPLWRKETIGDASLGISIRGVTIRGSTSTSQPCESSTASQLSTPDCRRKDLDLSLDILIGLEKLILLTISIPVSRSCAENQTLPLGMDIRARETNRGFALHY